MSIGNDAQDPLKRRLKAIRQKKTALAFAKSVLITVTVCYLLFGRVFGISIVRGSSMEPALKNGDLVLFFRLQQTYKRGDIVLKTEKGRRDVIKRIVAVPGQTVDIGTDMPVLRIDGMEVQEPYIYEKTSPKTGCEFPLTLGKNEYFLLGDHRENSFDSRNYGPVSEHRLDGAAIAVLRL